MLNERDSLHIPTMKETENARRLARYDEAVRFLQLAEPFCTLGLSERIVAFLAAEPKEGKGALIALRSNEDAGDWRAADALESFWRTHAASRERRCKCSVRDVFVDSSNHSWEPHTCRHDLPAYPTHAAQPKVAMSPELEQVLIAATRCARDEQYAAERLGMGIGYAKMIDAAIAAVRERYGRKG